MNFRTSIAIRIPLFVGAIVLMLFGRLLVLGPSCTYMYSLPRSATLAGNKLAYEQGRLESLIS